jgi:hypothetical protein
MNAIRTSEHERWEREAAACGCPFPERIRTLPVSIAGIQYRALTAIMSWRAADDELCCERCGQSLTVMGPNLLHAMPMAICPCSSSLLEPVDPRDAALIEMAHPISEEDARLAENFHREIARLTETKNPKTKSRRKTVSTQAAAQMKNNELNTKRIRH